MNYRVTIGFLLAVVVMAGLVFGLDKVQGGQQQAQATATAVSGQELQLFQFDDTKVNAFELRNGDNTVRVEKNSDGNWNVAGSGEPANRSSFTSLIIRMSTLKGTRRVDSSGNLADYGLDQVKESAKAFLDDGSTYQLDLGDKTPVQTGIYAKKADAPDVYVIATQFQTDLERLVSDPKEPPTPTPRPATPTPAAVPTAEGTPTP
jgi:Domain of unknown function (DUF4340)